MKKEGELAMFELRTVTDAWSDEDLGCYYVVEVGTVDFGGNETLEWG